MYRESLNLSQPNPYLNNSILTNSVQFRTEIGGIHQEAEYSVERPESLNKQALALAIDDDD